MSVPALPQLSAPFTIARDDVVTVEQGSVQETASNVYNIAVCPRGYRDDDPGFGIPEIAFNRMPVDLDALESDLREYEPDADLSIEQQRIAAGQAGITIKVE